MYLVNGPLKVFTVSIFLRLNKDGIQEKSKCCLRLKVCVFFFWHFGWYTSVSKPSFSWEFMTAFRSRPYPVILVLLLLHYCASSSLIASCFAPKYEILPIIRANIIVRLYAGPSYRMAFAWMFTDTGFLFVYQCASQSGLVYLWTDQHLLKSFFGSLNFTRPQFVSVKQPWAATCQRKFLEKLSWEILVCWSIWLCDITARCASYCSFL